MILLCNIFDDWIPLIMIQDERLKLKKAVRKEQVGNTFK